MVDSKTADTDQSNILCPLLATVQAKSDGISNEQVEKTARDIVKSEIFHGWVYIQTENLSFFVEPTTGLRHSITSGAYMKIDCLLNDTNYWLNLKGHSLSRKGKKNKMVEASSRYWKRRQTKT